MGRSSRISGFYNLSVPERRRIIVEWAELTPEQAGFLESALTMEQADKMVENVIGNYALPLGIATNIVVNGDDVLAPMVIEEPSVVAGASFAARLVRGGRRLSCRDYRVLDDRSDASAGACRPGRGGEEGVGAETAPD